MSRPFAKLDVFRAVADPTRRAMLARLRGGEMTAGQLGKMFRITQPAVSQHLRVLRRVDLVRQRRFGRSRLYRINPGPLTKLAKWIDRCHE